MLTSIPKDSIPILKEAHVPFRVFRTDTSMSDFIVVDVNENKADRLKALKSKLSIVSKNIDLILKNLNVA